MATGSTLTGRWMATLIVPPGAPDAAAHAPLLAAALADAPPAAEAAALAAALPPALAAALGDADVPLHAAMIMPIAPVESPRTVALWMNSRRLRRPAANASTTSSCSG